MPIEVPDTRAFADPPARRRRAAAGAPVPPVPVPDPVQPAVAAPAVVEQATADSTFRKPPVRRKRAAAAAKPAQAAPAEAAPAVTAPAEATPAGAAPVEAAGSEPDQPAHDGPSPAASAFSRPMRRRPKPEARAADQAAALPVPEAASPAGDAASADASPPDAAAQPGAAAPRGSAGEERRGTEGAVEEVVQLTDTVVVRLNGTRYAVAMEAVAEVGRPPHVTRVPGVPTWIAGVANWRGRILPVLDLRVLLGAPTPELGMTGRVMVLARDGVTLAFLAERVEGVVSLEMETLEPVLLTLSRTTASVLSGQLTHPDGPIAVLDLDTLFSLRSQLPRVRRAG